MLQGRPGKQFEVGIMDMSLVAHGPDPDKRSRYTAIFGRKSRHIF